MLNKIYVSVADITLCIFQISLSLSLMTRLYRIRFSLRRFRVIIRKSDAASGEAWQY